MTTPDTPEDDRRRLVERTLEALRQLDGTDAAAVSLVSGLSREELDGLGGFRDYRFEDPRQDEPLPEVHRTTRYLLLGHPAWPGNLSTSDPDHARRWYQEYRDTHPVFVDKVVEFRSRVAGPRTEQEQS